MNYRSMTGKIVAAIMLVSVISTSLPAFASGI